ncbi:MAG TPA: HD domain-containing protein, partial [Clostridiales bacterium]|nr:HD domain-containing protein [Clostridiales bacterium]
KVRGSINEYNGAEQLRVDMIRPLAANDEVRMEDLVPSSEHSGDKMLEEIFKVVESFEDVELKNLVLAVLNEHKEKIVYWPAAFRLHHAMRGGLLYHTLSILRLAQGVCKVYPFVNKDLLFAGVILHDLAKTGEFDVTEAGIATGYTTDGTLVGHLVRGAMEIERIGKELGTPKETLMLVEHMIISHHGEPEFGAVVRPMFLEAELLSQLDMMDARVYAISQAVDEVAPGEFTNRMWSLDNRKLYNHGRNKEEPKANLI